MTWRKSSRSNQTNACVEVRLTATGARVRDAKNATGPALAFPATRFAAFRDALKR
ncbi:DUF397 domain-containing protein [Saccharothrix obliqua]|uniref:DUF397 domain-containing protein n=1 Tax=Saccharothrix obliqua TaxID=2861747 RepID=UPI001C5EBB73|nr:DUF397 domain-containing protein [Saccharothrix obliqua]MBW4722511.1 DUF397 domain-containing protein [Saccharothrix obliqua]